MTETKRYSPIKLGSPGEDISKKDLHAVTLRFKNLNQLRQQRIQAFLQNRQQIFLHLLPLLFHQNHPLLPGYVSSETPAGIPDYKPNKQAIQAAKQFSKGFNYKSRALLNYSVQGVFLMGSVSSIAFSKTSDMDIWLCVQPNLSEKDLDELQKKATHIEKWAESYNLEVHFFLVNSEQFSEGQDIPMSEESSGTTQHYLLLEEFYRTAIYIAGRIPAWWLVPPHQEHNYSEYITHLIENRFISKNEVIDFGGLESIPAEEFISATLWHIYKSLNSPHKSLLKLFLMECYASEYPNSEWLSFELKNAIYQGTFDIDKLDPYLLIYSKVEKYLLEAGSTHRLNLVRQCFYLKIMGSSNKSLDYHSRLFREEYLQVIAEERNWPEDLLPALNKQKYWDIKKATQEHLIIRTQLKHCLRIILGLAGNYVEYNYRENEDLKLISRKLHTFLEKKPGKIEIITTRSAVHNKEDELTVVESSDQKSNSIWALFSGKFVNRSLSAQNVIKQERSLIALLCWLVTNGLYTKQLKLHFNSASLVLSRSELSQVLGQLFQFLSCHIDKGGASLDVYKKPDELLSSLVFINLGLSLSTEREDGMMVLSERSDPLSYGQNRLCFVEKVDRISISSWGEITISQYEGLSEYFSCLIDIFNRSKQPLSVSQLNPISYVPIRANSIIIRTESIYENLINFFNQVPAIKKRYVLPGEQDYFIFQYKNNHLQFWSVDSPEQLIDELASIQTTFNDVCFDPGVLENTLIPFVYTLNQAQMIQVFFYHEKAITYLYIIDEKGALFVQEHKQSENKFVLNQYSIFFESILNHPYYKNDVQLKLYEIQKNTTTGVCTAYPTQWAPIVTFGDLSIRLTSIADRSSSTPSVNYIVYCNDIEFSTDEYGDQLFEEIARYILDFRQNKDSYPIYISDIDVPSSYLGVTDDEQTQTIHYLKYKKKIEQKLNGHL